MSGVSFSKLFYVEMIYVGKTRGSKSLPVLGAAHQVPEQHHRIQ